MSGALRVAIVGAESTGKTTLARALAVQAGERSRLEVAWVGEVLREWCDRNGRTPRADEQPAIADEQARRIDTAAQHCDMVICDTTPLMTAVYSAMLFDDTSLVAPAIDFQRRCHLTLLTALDLPWVADGLQRDGPHVREPVDRRLRTLLAEHGLAWHTVTGTGSARLAAALEAVASLTGYCRPVEGRG